MVVVGNAESVTLILGLAIVLVLLLPAQLLFNSQRSCNTLSPAYPRTY